ncbi:MAG: hypothetical protein ACQETL_03950 [Bacteroidota bacterium]
MKTKLFKTFIFLLLGAFLFSACNKSSFQTRKGKKKLKYYNSIQHQ